jgi:probable HAF family extracellular repeat protein
MTTQQQIRFTTGKVSRLLLAILIAAGCGGAALAQAKEKAKTKAKAKETQYQISNLDSLGGTNSRGNSINNRGWVAGYSNLAGNQSRRAALWQDSSILDLGTLGGPNSSVTWNVKNNRGIIVGIAQTATPDPLGEAWSSAAFYPGANSTGFINLGFVWEMGEMRGLPTLGGNNGFATGANNRGQVVGWAENTCHDPTCVPPQVLQFRPVVWELDPDQAHELPLIPGDTSGAATAINDKGQVVGISGICDQAVGRHTAKHAVLWDNGEVTDIGDLGAEFWNTPTAINQHGDVVGFAGSPGDPEGNALHAFIWTKADGIRALGELPGHTYSEASGINEHGQVVGVSCDPDFADCRAVIWENGVITDLNDLKAPGFPARLDNAKDINDQREITGRATDPITGRKAFRAVPVHGNK